MKQITKEQALAIAKAEQVQELLGIDQNDVDSLFQAMKGRDGIYYGEASINEPQGESFNRIGTLLDSLKSEVTTIERTPRYFFLLVKASEDTPLQMDEMMAITEFLSDYEEVEAKWTFGVDKETSNLVEIQFICVME